jgi:hypothetical protein
MSGFWRTANCERGSATYSDMLIANRILMHAEKGNLHIERESFPGIKRPKPPNSPLPCSVEDENAVICTSTLLCVLMAGSLGIAKNLQLLLPIYCPLKIDETIFHTFVKVCCREWIWRGGSLCVTFDRVRGNVWVVLLLFQISRSPNKINTDKCTHVLLNHNFINTLRSPACFNP